jgi:hypothetical protein
MSNLIEVDRNITNIKNEISNIEKNHPDNIFTEEEMNQIDNLENSIRKELDKLSECFEKFVCQKEEKTITLTEAIEIIEYFVDKEIGYAFQYEYFQDRNGFYAQKFPDSESWSLFTAILMLEIIIDPLYRGKKEWIGDKGFEKRLYKAVIDIENKIKRDIEYMVNHGIEYKEDQIKIKNLKRYFKVNGFNS